MSPDDIQEQARQFVQWHQKRGGSFEDDFGAWCYSKDLEPWEVARIRVEAKALLVAIGNSTVTDIFNPWGGAA